MEQELRNLSLKKRARSYSKDVSKALIADMAGLQEPDFEPIDMAGVVLPFPAPTRALTRTGLGAGGRVLDYVPNKLKPITENLWDRMRGLLNKEFPHKYQDEFGRELFGHTAEYLQPWYGKTLAEDVINPMTGDLMHSAGTSISPKMAEKIAETGIERILTKEAGHVPGRRNMSVLDVLDNVKMVLGDADYAAFIKKLGLK